MDFRKVGEFDLSEVIPNLSPHDVNTRYGLMFQAKDQPVEEVMDYYDMNLMKSK